MKRNRLAVWLDVNDSATKWLKEQVAPRERAKVVREALTLYLNRDNNSISVAPDVDENTVIVGEAVLNLISLQLPQKEISDDLITEIVVRGIRELKKEEEEREKRELLNSLKGI